MSDVRRMIFLPDACVLCMIISLNRLSIKTHNPEGMTLI